MKELNVVCPLFRVLVSRCFALLVSRLFRARSVATGPDDSALRADQGQFDATGNIPCAQFKGQPMGQCEFGVARAGGGYATVVINKPDGHSRAIYFRMGKPIGADTSEADGYLKFSASKESDLHLIRIGNERYEIPDAVIFGG